jgi:hypothetical protein
MPSHQPALRGEIEKFENNYIALSDTQYLISTTGTAVELCAKLGIYDKRQPDKPATGNAVILAISSYFGRAPATVWEWMKAKLESSPSG